MIEIICNFKFQINNFENDDLDNYEKNIYKPELKNLITWVSILNSTFHENYDYSRLLNCISNFPNLKCLQIIGVRGIDNILQSLLEKLIENNVLVSDLCIKYAT